MRFSGCCRIEHRISNVQAYTRHIPLAGTNQNDMKSIFLAYSVTRYIQIYLKFLDLAYTRNIPGIYVVWYMTGYPGYTRYIPHMVIELVYTRYIPMNI